MNDNSVCCFRFFGSDVKKGTTSYVLWRVFAVIAAILIVVLVPLSAKTVSNGEMVLRYNKVSRVLSREVLGEGLHFLPPATKMFKFSSIFISTVGSAITCISRDGLPIRFTPSTQHQFVKNELRQSFKNIGDSNDLHMYFLEHARTSVLDVCGNFTGSEFFTKRQEIGSTFNNHLNQRMLADELVKFSVGLNQLRNFELPGQLNSAIRDVQVALDQFKEVIRQRNEHLILAETDARIAAEADRAMIVAAEAEASGVTFARQTVAQSRNNLWSEVEKLMTTERANLGLTPKEYVAYLLKGALVKNLTDRQRACLSNCDSQSSAGSGNHCWYCWVNTAVPAI